MTDTELTAHHRRVAARFNAKCEAERAARRAQKDGGAPAFAPITSAVSAPTMTSVAAPPAVTIEPAPLGPHARAALAAAAEYLADPGAYLDKTADMQAARILEARFGPSEVAPTPKMSPSSVVHQSAEDAEADRIVSARFGPRVDNRFGELAEHNSSGRAAEPQQSADHAAASSDAEADVMAQRILRARFG